jgi:hypothetical protein
MLTNFIFFTPLAAGMAVWPAVVRVARGTWSQTIERSALAGAAFAGASLAAFAGLWVGREHWAGWMHHENLHNAWWLDTPLLFARDAAALTLLWLMAGVFARSPGAGRSKAFAGWLVFAYAIVFSLMAFDLVMALDPHWYSTLFGIYYFVSGMYAAAAAWTLVVLLRRQADAGQRHDLGNLIVTFSLLTTYMMFSQLIVIWYENLPEEVRFVIPRLRLDRWGWVSALLLAVIYLGPLVLLLVRRTKLSPWYLGAVAMAVIAGLWLERWWLVTPTLGGRLVLGLPELSITVAFVAALVLSIGLFDRCAPAAAAAQEAGQP